MITVTNWNMSNIKIKKKGKKIESIKAIKASQCCVCINTHIKSSCYRFVNGINTITQPENKSVLLTDRTHGSVFFSYLNVFLSHFHSSNHRNKRQIYSPISGGHFYVMSSRCFWSAPKKKRNITCITLCHSPPTYTPTIHPKFSIIIQNWCDD